MMQLFERVMHLLFLCETVAVFAESTLALHVHVKIRRLRFDTKI